MRGRALGRVGNILRSPSHQGAKR